MPGDGCACIKDMLACLPILLFSSSVFVAAHSPQACSASDNMSLEQTFIMIKPDGVARGLVGEVIKRFEQKVGLCKSLAAQICEMPAVCGTPFAVCTGQPLQAALGREQTAARSKSGDQLEECLPVLSVGAAQGYYLRALKLKNVERELAEEHYVDLKSKPFYPGLVEYIIRRAVLWLACPGSQLCKESRAALCAQNLHSR